MFGFFIICIPHTNAHVINIKALSTLKHIIKNNSVIRYYKSPTLDLLRQNKIKETNILERLMNYKERRQPRVAQFSATLHKKKFCLHKLLNIRAKLYQEQMKSHISSGDF